MMKSTQAVAVVKSRRNGKEPIGCGFGTGRASGLQVSCKYEKWNFCSNSDLLGEEKVPFYEATVV
jgi:hypothetical protein